MPPPAPMRYHFFFSILIIITLRLSHSPVSSTSAFLTNSTLSSQSHHINNLFKMKFFAAAALFATAAIAGPVEVRTGTTPICPSGLYSNPQCCDTLVLGIVGLGCEVRKFKQTLYSGLLIKCILIGVLQPPKLPVTASTSRTSAPRLATRPFAVFFPL